jgi:hypothetical protein
VYDTQGNFCGALYFVYDTQGTYAVLSTLCMIPKEHLRCSLLCIWYPRNICGALYFVYDTQGTYAVLSTLYMIPKEHLRCSLLCVWYPRNICGALYFVYDTQGTFAVLSTLYVIPNFSWIDHGFHFMHVLDVAMLISFSVNIHHIPGKNCSHATWTRSLYKFYTLWILEIKIQQLHNNNMLH